MPQSNLEEKVNPSILKDEFSSSKDPSILTSKAPVLFRNVGERSAAKYYHRVSLLFVVSQVFEKLVSNRIVDHLGKCGLFSDFQ